MVDFEEWYRESLGVETPWGAEQTPAFAAAVESELERALATSVLRSGIRMPRRRLDAGEVLVREGEPGDELFILLDGVLEVEVDGAVVAHVGSGAILGERAVLEGGRRTATLRAVRSSRVAVIGAGMIDRTALSDVALAHRREAS
jgi:CRP-like cAMP-binding protein